MYFRFIYLAKLIEAHIQLGLYTAYQQNNKILDMF